LYAASPRRVLAPRAPPGPPPPFRVSSAARSTTRTPPSRDPPVSARWVRRSRLLSRGPTRTPPRTGIPSESGRVSETGWRASSHVPPPCLTRGLIWDSFSVSWAPHSLPFTCAPPTPCLTSALKTLPLWVLSVITFLLFLFFLEHALVFCCFFGTLQWMNSFLLSLYLSLLFGCLCFGFLVVFSSATHNMAFLVTYVTFYAPCRLLIPCKIHFGISSFISFPSVWLKSLTSDTLSHVLRLCNFTKSSCWEQKFRMKIVRIWTKQEPFNPVLFYEIVLLSNNSHNFLKLMHLTILQYRGRKEPSSF